MYLCLFRTCLFRNNVKININLISYFLSWLHNFKYIMLNLGVTTLYKYCEAESINLQTREQTAGINVLCELYRRKDYDRAVPNCKQAIYKY